MISSGGDGISAPSATRAGDPRGAVVAGQVAGERDERRPGRDPAEPEVERAPPTSRPPGSSSAPAPCPAGRRVRARCGGRRRPRSSSRRLGAVAGVARRTGTTSGRRAKPRLCSATRAPSTARCQRAGLAARAERGRRVARRRVDSAGPVGSWMSARSAHRGAACRVRSLHAARRAGSCGLQAAHAAHAVRPQHERRGHARRRSSPAPTAAAVAGTTFSWIGDSAWAGSP